MSAFEFMPQFGLSIMLGCLVMVVLVIRKESDIPVITISQLLLLFWLFLLGFLVDWIRKDQVKVKKKTRSRRQKSRRFRRKKLPSVLVIPCRTRRNTPQDRQQCRWRRKQRKLRTRVKSQTSTVASEEAAEDVLCSLVKNPRQETSTVASEEAAEDVLCSLTSEPC